MGNNGELSLFGQFGDGFEWLIKWPDETNSQYRTDASGVNLYVFKNGTYWRLSQYDGFSLPHNDRVARAKVAREFNISDPDAPEIPAIKTIRRKFITSHMLRSKKYNNPIG